MALAKKKSMNQRNREKKGDADRITQIAQTLFKKQEELITKHNDLAKQINELVVKQQGLSITMGRGFQEIWQNALGSMERQDLNIIAMSELQREMIGQLLVLAEDGEMTDAKLEEIKLETEKTYKRLMAEAFDKARDRMAREREEAVAKFEAEKKAQAEAAEQVGIEAELKAAAESDRGIQSVSSTGGPGADIPEGADVFGG